MELTRELEKRLFESRRPIDRMVAREKKRVIEAYKDDPEIARGVAAGIGKAAALWTEDAEAVKEAVKFVSKMYVDEDVKRTIEAYKNTPEIGGEVATWIGEVAYWREDVEGVKRLSKLLANKKIGRKLFALDISSTELREMMIKYSDLLEKEGEKGIYKIVVGNALGIDPRVKNFKEKVGEVSSKKYGVDVSDLTLQELTNTIESFESLDEGKNTFKKLLKLLGEGKYWEDREVKEVLKEMNKYGINTEKLRGSCWVYRKDGNEVSSSISYGEACENLILSLIAGKEEVYKKALETVSEIDSREKIEKARGVVQSNRKLRSEVFKLYRQKKLDEALDRLEKYAASVKKKSGEALHDLVQAVKGLKRKKICGDYLIGFYGKSIPLLYSNKSTMCCALLPHGLNKYGSVLYQLDPRVLTIGYAFVDELERGKEIEAVREKGEVDGIVIGYIGLYEDEPILVVDSVEGGRTFRNWLEKNYEIVKGDVEGVAKNLGIHYVVYNTKVYNETPRVFNKKLKGKIATVDVDRIGGVEIPYDYARDGRQYLEAFGGWELPKGKVKGYLYEVS